MMVFLVPLACATFSISQANALLKYFEPSHRMEYIIEIDSAKASDETINVRDLVAYIRTMIKTNQKINETVVEPVIWRFIPRNSFYNRVYKQVDQFFYDDPRAFFPKFNEDYSYNSDFPKSNHIKPIIIREKIEDKLYMLILVFDNGYLSQVGFHIE